MDDQKIFNIPNIHGKIESKCAEIGFTMPSDLYVGALLKTLITSKPKAHLLELGTGIGLSLSWMIDGMDSKSSIISIDNDSELIELAHQHIGNDERVEIICADGAEWLNNYQGEKFDLIFADTWPGKYHEVHKVLELLKVGGFYIIDDMLPQPNWLEGHEQKVLDLIEYLEGRKDLNLTKMNWSTGIIVAVKK